MPSGKRRGASDAPLSVLHVCNGLAGGIGSVLLNYSRHVDRTVVRFDFLLLHEPDPHVREEVEELGSTISLVPPFRRKPWENLRGAMRVIRNSGADIVHVHTASPTSLTYLILAMVAGKRIRIVHSHATGLEAKGGSWQYRIHGMLRPALRLLATNWVACSVAAGDWLFGERARGRVRLVHNAIDVEEFRFDPTLRESVRRELGVEQGLVVGHVGRFVEVKNHTFLAEAFGEVAKSAPDAHLVLAGDGPTLGEVRERCAALGLAEQVLFLGARSDVPALMQGMDVLMLPSISEGLPLVLIEAQTSGMRCIASNGVSKEADLGSVSFLDLGAGPEPWAETILAGPADAERGCGVQRVESAGYSVALEARRLAEYYRELHVGHR